MCDCGSVEAVIGFLLDGGDDGVRMRKLEREMAHVFERVVDRDR